MHESRMIPPVPLMPQDADGVGTQSPPSAGVGEGVGTGSPRCVGVGVPGVGEKGRGRPTSWTGLPPPAGEPPTKPAATSPAITPRRLRPACSTLMRLIASPNVVNPPA